MDSLVGYGSDDDNETERYNRHSSGFNGGSGPRRREDDTNYDDVNMDMSEESQGGESEPELPQAESSSRHTDREDRRSHGRRERPRKESPPRAPRDERRDRQPRSERGRYEASSSSRRGLLGDKPDEKSSENNKMPALMDLKPFGGEAPVPPAQSNSGKSQDTRDAVSPRFVERDRRERERDRDRDSHRHNRRSEERRSYRSERRSRSRDRGDRPRSRGYPSDSSSSDRRVSPTVNNEYRPSSYKVNRKLEVMEKMGLQIKTPDGSMATAQQLRQAASEPNSLPSYYNPSAVNTNKILDQVQKRKLLWSGKRKAPAAEAGAWTGTKFAQDNDGKQTEKFMRLMGIKEPVPAEQSKTVDPIKKQEEMFQAMQAQYEVARATTHTMRGVGLGFQRGPY